MSTINTSANQQNDSSVTTDKKEQEPSSNTSTTDPPSTNPVQNESQLLSKAQQLIQQNDYYSASDLLSNALSIIQQKNIATSIESIPYYIAYGEALLRLIQSSNELFAPPQPQEQPEEPAEPEAPELVTDTNGTDNKDNKDTTDTNTKEENDEDNDTTQNDIVAEAAPAVIDTSEDREIAWETFEYARTILEDYIAEHTDDTVSIAKLALVHSYLGELLIEDENNEAALKEFECALEVQNKCKDEVKYRQRAFDRFMACLAAQFCGKDDDALKHCNIALGEISQRIIGILKVCGCDDIKDNEYDVLMERAEKVLGSMKDDMKDSADGKELKEMVQSMDELMSKLEEIKSVMERKVRMKDNESNANGEGNGNVDVGGDPLAKLIQGLTARYGIDEGDFAQYDEMMEKKDKDDNVNGDRNDTEGVTTFGFGNNVNDDDVVNDLGNFGGKTSANKENKGDGKERKKRSLEEAGLDVDDGLNGNVKKMKLNSGEAVGTESEK